MQGRDFLEVVRRLRSEQTEPFVRDRIGRAYYASYLEARTFCTEHLGYVRTRSSREHQDVARMIASQHDRIYERLTFLRSLRNTADYELQVSLATLTANAEDAELYAEEIIARLDELAAERESTPESPEIDD